MDLEIMKRHELIADHIRRIGPRYRDADKRAKKTMGIGKRNRLFLHPLCGRPGRDPGAGSIEGYANLTSASFWPAPRRELVRG